MKSSEVAVRAHAAERKFGIAVGGAFLLLGSWWLFRGKFTRIAPFVAGAGAALAVLGIVVPRALVLPNRGWMAMAEKLSIVSTTVVLSIVFFVAVTPIGLIKRLTGWDPLRRRAGAAPSYWVPYPERQKNTRHYERMY